MSKQSAAGKRMSTTPSPMSVALTAELRAGMARKRMSGMALARLVGTSQNYLAKRLRDEAVLTVDDFILACAALGLDPSQILAEALQRARGVK